MYDIFIVIKSFYMQSGQTLDLFIRGSQMLIFNIELTLETRCSAKNFHRLILCLLLFGLLAYQPFISNQMPNLVFIFIHDIHRHIYDMQITKEYIHAEMCTQYIDI